MVEREGWHHEDLLLQAQQALGPTGSSFPLNLPHPSSFFQPLLQHELPHHHHPIPFLDSSGAACDSSGKADGYHRRDRVGSYPPDHCGAAVELEKRL